MLRSGNVPIWMKKGITILIQKDIKKVTFYSDSLSALLFCVCMLALTHIVRDAVPRYHFANNRKKVNHLHFMDDLKLYESNEKSLESLIQTVRVFSNDIAMEFGVGKCAVLTMKNKIMVNSDGIALPNERVIEGDIYKYLGVIQEDETKHYEMKEKFKTEHYRLVRNVLEMKLNGEI